MQLIKLKKINTSILIFMVYLVIFFIFGEFLVRYFFNNEKSEIKYLLNNGFYTYPISSELSFINEDDIEVKITTDKYGLRNLNTDKINNTIVLGDSFIGAVNTENEKTFTSNLNAYNAGVDGYSTFQSLRLLDTLLEDSSPKIVILAFALTNDFRDNFHDQVNGLVKDFPSEVAQNQISVKGRFVNIIKKSELITHAYHLFKNLNVSPSMRSYAVSEIYSYLSNPNEEFTIALKNTEQAFERLRQMSDKHGFKVVIVGIPSKAQVYKSFKEITHYENDNQARLVALSAIKNGFDFDAPDKRINKISDKFNFQYISLLNTFRENSSRKIYYYIDSHWSYIGQKIASDFVIDKLN